MPSLRRGGARDPNPIIVVLFHPADFVDAGLGGTTTVEDFRAILRWTRQQRDVQVTTLGDICRSGADTGAARMTRNLSRSQSCASRLLPSYGMQSRVYWSESKSQIPCWTKAIVYHGLLASASLTLGWAIWHYRSGMLGATAATACMTLIVLGVVVGSFRMSANRLFRVATAASCLTGLAIGSFVH